MRNSLFCAAALLSVLVAAPAVAELNVGWVNVQRLLDEAPQAKSAMQSLQDQFSPRQRELDSAEKSLIGEVEKLKNDAAVMSEDERRTAERSIRDKQRDLARRRSEFAEDLNMRRNEELGRLQSVVLKEVQEFAESGGFDLIVSDGVLFASSSVDVTSQVLEKLKSAGN